MFEYDPQLALDYQEHERYEQNGISIYDVSYASPMGGRASAFLLMPQRKGSLAGILFMHPGGLDRYAFLDEAMVFAQRGAVTLLLDAPYARLPQRPIFSFSEQDRDDFIQNVVDLRRGVDLLIEQLEIEVQRIGYVGFSYGATVGAMLAGVEKRIKAYVLWGGAAHLTDFLRGRGKTIPPAELEAYLEIMTALDSIQHISHAAPSALFFQNGRRDKNVPEQEAIALHRAANEPKQVAWYNAGHALNARAHRERFAWLREQLDLDPLSPELSKKLGQISLKSMSRSNHERFISVQPSMGT
jgi:dienelactone hydrolase